MQFFLLVLIYLGAMVGFAGGSDQFQFHFDPDDDDQVKGMVSQILGHDPIVNNQAHATSRNAARSGSLAREKTRPLFGLGGPLQAPPQWAADGISASTGRQKLLSILQPPQQNKLYPGAQPAAGLGSNALLQTGTGQYRELQLIGGNSFNTEKGYVMAMLLHMIWVRMMGGDSRQMYNSISMMLPQFFNNQVANTML